MVLAIGVVDRIGEHDFDERAADAVEQACPGEDDLAAFVDTRLAHPRARALEAHFARCTACRRLLSALARAAATGSGTVAGSRAPTLPIDARERDGEPALGPRFGRYLVLDRLGAGGMGVVYSAYDTELDRRVALKVLRDDHRPANQRAVHELLREARAMAQLAHPNVVTVFDAGSVGGRVYIAMELVDGLTLRAWLAAERRGWREIVAVFVAAGTGLAAAHAAGLIHRDFKPDNVIIGNDGRVRVTDFGLARAAPRAALDAAVRDGSAPPTAGSGQSSGVVGTLAYMAPEQYLGRADARADQYSFAVALYEALFRVRPIESPGLAGARSDARRRRGIDPRRSSDDAARGSLVAPPRDGVPAALHRVLRRALHRAPDERYPSMAALLAELAPRPWRGRAVAIGALVVTAAAVAFAGGYAIHLGNISQQRAALVGRLRGVAAELRTQLRTAHMLPRHDIRPERDKVRGAMGEVERELQTPAGQDEIGLGDYVLGEGHRALGQNAQALALLEAAWAAGERGPHIDLALGDVLGAEYESQLSDLESTVQSSEREAKARRLEQRYRDPALVHLRAALAAGVGTPAYLEAEIAFHAHDFAESSRRAHAAFTDSPTLYEAGALEAQAHNEAGRALLARNRMDEASAEFATAREVFERVLEIARSDDQTSLAYAAMISAQANALGQGVLPPDLQRKALDALHAAEQINPSAWEPLLSEIEFHQQEANNAIFQYRDPGPYVDQMLALTTAARAHGAPSESVDVYVCLALWEQGTFQGSHGVDPRATFQQAVAACERAAAANPGFGTHDSLGVVYAAQASYLADHGGDPMPAFALAERNYRASIDVDDVAVLHANLGRLWIELARYRHGHGMGLAHAIDDAQVELDRTIAMDAMRGDAWARKGEASILRARSLRSEPQAERRALNEARDDLDRAAKLEPALIATRRLRIQLAELDAELLLAGHASPLPAADRMQRDARLLLQRGPDDSFGHRSLCRAELITAQWALGHHQAVERELALAASEAAKARAADPVDALAWTASAEVELVRAEAARAHDGDPDAAITAGDAFIQRALTIDPRLAQARELREALTAQRARQH